MGDGAEQQVMQHAMCTDNAKEGSCWERQSQRRLQRCRTWPDLYLQIRLVLWLSGQHLNRPCNSGEKNRQMANLSKCRDSLRFDR
jgi:hypothetical protein